MEIFQLTGELFGLRNGIRKLRRDIERDNGHDLGLSAHPLGQDASKLADLADTAIDRVGTSGKRVERKFLDALPCISRALSRAATQLINAKEKKYPDISKFDSFQVAFPSTLALLEIARDLVDAAWKRLQRYEMQITRKLFNSMRSISPFKLLREAIKEVPSLKYALGVCGMVSCIAIVKLLGVDYRVAAWGTLIIVFLMAVLLFFSWAVSFGSGDAKKIARYFLYAMLLLFVLTSFSLFGSVFFGWPTDLSTWLK